jgi:Flp pilus assembly protein TadG
MHTPVLAMVVGRVRASMVRFRDDERGSMALIILFTFLAMIMFGGIAVDVMRFETRRVAMQQTLDRAALAASGLPETDDLTKVLSPEDVAKDWFAKANLDDGLFMVEYSVPTVKAINIPGKREVEISASVKSHNFFMGIFSPRDYLEGPTATKAAQGVTNIEVMLVLDITGSMGETIDGTKTKLQALKEAANSFVDIVKAQDTKNGVSIGVVPYAAQVNAPLALRQQFNETHVSSWDGVANAGVPNINCLEFPVSGFNTTGVPLSTPIPMAAVADSNSGTTTDGTRVAPQAPTATSRACTTNAESGATAWVDAEVNQVMLPTKDGAKVKTKIDRLTAQGNTYIAVGMRWGTALIDQEARDIYTNLIPATEKMTGRPANNGAGDTRKIIILMTDGEHVTNNHIRDEFKAGPSPIWRGTDGNYAIRFTSGGTNLTGGARPATCSGFPIATTREYFVPHLKDNAESPRVNVTDVEGFATSTPVANACDPNAWFAAPSWPQTVADGSDANDERDVVTVPDGPDADILPDVVMVTATQLDWSEVWRYLRVSWVAQQLYVRSGVTGATNYSTVMNAIRTTYLSNVSNMNALLQQNCAIARKAVAAPVSDLPIGKGAGIEIYGIMFDNAPSTGGIAQIKGCASEPKTTYYWEPKSSGDLLAAFNQIATDISDLRLTQ